MPEPDRPISARLSCSRPRGRRRRARARARAVYDLDAVDGERLICALPVADLHDTIGRRRHARGMRDDDDRRAVILAKPMQRIEHALLVRLVELRCRLVGEHERCVARCCGGDRNALLLAAGEHRGRPVRGVLEAELAERCARVAVAPGEPQRRVRRSRPR